VRRLKASDLEVTEEERRLAREAEEAAGYGGTGSAIGSGVGGALGALGFLGGPALGAVTTGLGASLGGAGGGLIGSAIGGEKGQKASDRLADIDRERQKRVQDYQLRQQALDALMGQR
jgi:hypothetical protein